MDIMQIEESKRGITRFFQYAGIRYWTASLLPALVGTTLPLWLRPPGFSFRWLGAVEFLAAAILVHAGFSFLKSWSEQRFISGKPDHRLLILAGLCIFMGCLLGLDLNQELKLHEGVYEGIFIVYGLSTLFVGFIYAAPPVSFWRREGGEIVLSEGLGFIPILGAYLVQVGDITRTVYLASLPIVVATGLWVWIDQLIRFEGDDKVGRRTLVSTFGTRTSARYGVLGISLVYVAALLLAAISGSVSPWGLAALVSFFPLWKTVVITWNEFIIRERLTRARWYAFYVHLVACSCIIISSLFTQST